MGGWLGALGAIPPLPRPPMGRLTLKGHGGERHALLGMSQDESPLVATWSEW